MENEKEMRMGANKKKGKGSLVGKERGGGGGGGGGRK